MDILVEVNIGREENKSGVLPEALSELLEQAARSAGASRARPDGHPAGLDAAKERDKRLFFKAWRNILLT